MSAPGDPNTRTHPIEVVGNSLPPVFSPLSLSFLLIGVGRKKDNHHQPPPPRTNVAHHQYLKKSIGYAQSRTCVSSCCGLFSAVKPMKMLQKEKQSVTQPSEPAPNTKSHRRDWRAYGRVCTQCGGNAQRMDYFAFYRYEESSSDAGSGLCSPSRLPRFRGLCGGRLRFE